MGYTFGTATVGGKVAQDPKTRGELTQVTLNVAERRKVKDGQAAPAGVQVDDHGYYWAANLLAVRATGKAAESWAKLKAGDRVLVEAGELDHMSYKGVDKEGQERDFKRVIVKTFRAPMKCGSDNINHAVLLGRVGSDPKTTDFEGGGAKMAFSLAHDVPYRDADNEWKDETVWINIELVGRRVEQARKLIAKGKQLLVSGRLERQTWNDANGQKQEKVVLKTWDFLLVGNKPASRDGAYDSSDMPDDDGGSWDDYGPPDDHYEATEGKVVQPQGKPAPAAAAKRESPHKKEAADDLDQEIPF